MSAVFSLGRNRDSSFMKLLRTIRLDPSDTFVFERAAEPGEWAVPGSFAFMSDDPERLEGKSRVAFRSGFLGIESLGWSTLVQIVTVSPTERMAAVGLLAKQLLARFGAPDTAAANAAAEEEIAFASSLCEQQESTIIALKRTLEHGNIRETFRTLRPSEGARPARAFSFLQAADDDEESTGDEVRLIDLTKGPRA
jgi:hypothetical protein